MALRLPAFVVGPSIRTTNSIEKTERAKIPGLWEKAIGDGELATVENRIDDCFYAVLWDYQSDESGTYSQVVGVGIDDPKPYRSSEKWKVVSIPSEQRLFFDASGDQPKSLIDTWQKIWESTASGALSRAFSVDVEKHSVTKTEIWISVSD